MIEFFSGERESALPENWDAGDPVDPYGEFEQDFDLETLFAPLPERTRQVLELYYRRGLEAEEIGEEAGDGAERRLPAAAPGPREAAGGVPRWRLTACSSCSTSSRAALRAARAHRCASTSSARGERGDELARMLDRFLASAPPPPPPPERVEMMRAWLAGEPPILELRKQRGLTRDVVVDRLLGLLGLKEERRAKVRRYYHELETGLLEPRGVDRRVWEALADVLGAGVARSGRAGVARRSRRSPHSG